MRTRRSAFTTPITWPGRGSPWPRMANANLNPRTESKVDTKNPDRGPLLILDGEKDHGSLGGRQRRLQAAEAQPERHRDQKMPNRGHSLTIDHGWQEVAQTALDFVKRFVPASRASRHRSAGRRQSSALLRSSGSTGTGIWERTLAQLRNFDIRSLVPHGQG